MPEENPLAALGKLSEPASKLVDKISEAVGGLCKPWQIRRVAEAEADAAIIQAKSQIEITELQRRTFHRFAKEEEQRQVNMEEITKKALPLVEEAAKPEAVEKDWIANFFDRCRNISNDEMQGYWAKLLAGEANEPGTYSQFTVNLLPSLSTEDAKLFSKLNNFTVHFGAWFPLVLDEQNDFYKYQGITFESLSHLEDLGLIKFSPALGFERKNLGKAVPLLYQKRKFILILKNAVGNTMSIGRVIYSRAGRELSNLCEPTPMIGLIEYLIQFWIKGKGELMEIDSSLGEEEINRQLQKKIYGKQSQDADQ